MVRTILSMSLSFTDQEPLLLIQLVKCLYEEGLLVHGIPGPSALMCACGKSNPTYGLVISLGG